MAKHFTPKFPAQFEAPKYQPKAEYVTERHMDHDYVCSVCEKVVKGSALINRSGYWRHANCRRSANPTPVSELRMWQGECSVEGCTRQAFIKGSECVEHL